MKGWLATLGVTQKVVVTVAAVGLAAGVATVGTFATFNSSASQDQATNTVSGTVKVALGAANSAANRLDVAASAILPGDTMQRSVDLINSGTANLAAVTMSTSASPSSLLDSDTVRGLQMTVDRCPVAWTESASPPYTYSCANTATTVLASVPVIQTNTSLNGLSALSAGGVDHLRVTLTFPSGAPGDNLLNNSPQSSKFTFSFTGVQRTGTGR